MRKTATALLTPLAALAVAGTVGTGPAQATGHDGYGHQGEHEAPSAELVTSEEASTAISDAGVTIDAIEPATAEPQEDGTTELSFPLAESPEEQSAPTTPGEDEQVQFDGGIEFGSESGTASAWEAPQVSTSDGTVTVEIEGEQVDVLQAVPADEDEGDDEGDETAARTATDSGDHEDYGEKSDEADLVLTADGADALNEVTGEDTFAEGDVFASADDEDHDEDHDEDEDQDEEQAETH